jgi:hypothetical protein
MEANVISKPNKEVTFGRQTRNVSGSWWDICAGRQREGAR